VSCAREWAEIRDLRQLGRGLPFATPSAERVEAVRSALLSRVAAPTRRRWVRWTFAGISLAAAASAVVVWQVARRIGDVPPTPTANATSQPEGSLPRDGTAAALDPISPSSSKELSRATIHPTVGARVTRGSSLPDEVLHLSDGAITVEVAPLQHGERFRIITGDAEVEVKGTAFDVVSRDGRLRSVRVHHGSVEVRRAGRSVTLQAGEQWPPLGERTDSALPREPSARERVLPHAPGGKGNQASTPSAATSSSEPIPVVPAPSAPSRARPSPTATELAFRRGWDALRAGRPAEAATEFARARTPGPPDPLNEDAWFWEGVALARAGRPRDAAHNLKGFLAEYPGSARRAEVTALLAWQLLALGDLDAAEARFRVLADDHPEELRESVRRGLDEIRRRRSPGPTDRGR
jgi:TolA-binding protein